jgi:hypothetical protein
MGHLSSTWILQSAGVVKKRWAWWTKQKEGQLSQYLRWNIDIK